MPPAHTSRDFETELRELRAQSLAMGARCERIVRVAIEAFWSGEPELVAQVQTIDSQIDRDELAIHALALRILAVRQPVADDLRFVAAALRLITDLERVGDEAVNISERASGDDSEVRTLARPELDAMAADTQEMLHSALQAFVDRNAESAALVLAKDDAVDERCSSVMGSVTDYLTQHPTEVHGGLRVIRVAKYLERIADHATNVAEEAIFMVRGDDVRHGHLEPPRSR
jgi:phosphate transport system protein